MTASQRSDGPLTVWAPAPPAGWRKADQVVDVTVESIAADALGARRVSEMALNAARSETVRSLLVSDAEIIVARQALWDHHRLAVEHGAATALAGLLSPDGYRPAAGEKVCVVLCGANTDPTDLANYRPREKPPDTLCLQRGGVRRGGRC